jgi:hypothetical protein
MYETFPFNFVFTREICDSHLTGLVGGKVSFVRRDAKGGTSINDQRRIGKLGSKGKTEEIKEPRRATVEQTRQIHRAFALPKGIKEVLEGWTSCYCRIERLDEALPERWYCHNMFILCVKRLSMWRAKQVVTGFDIATTKHTFETPSTVGDRYLQLEETNTGDIVCAEDRRLELKDTQPHVITSVKGIPTGRITIVEPCVQVKEPRRRRGELVGTVEIVWRQGWKSLMGGKVDATTAAGWQRLGGGRIATRSA